VAHPVAKFNSDMMPCPQSQEEGFGALRELPAESLGGNRKKKN
jgi:hypothetical protein